MRTDEEIRKRAMRGIYTVYFARQIGQPVVRAFVFLAALLSSLSFVSVPQVIANTSGVESMAGLMTFMLSAFLETEFFVQAAILIAGSVVVWTAFDLLKSLSTGKNTQTA